MKEMETLGKNQMKLLKMKNTLRISLDKFKGRIMQKKMS